jgi:hypothetical protein
MRRALINGQTIIDLQMGVGKITKQSKIDLLIQRMGFFPKEIASDMVIAFRVSRRSLGKRNLNYFEMLICSALKAEVPSVVHALIPNLLSNLETRR